MPGGGFALHAQALFVLAYRRRKDKQAPTMFENLLSLRKPQCTAQHKIPAAMVTSDAVVNNVLRTERRY
jgi:hypothetical protein